MTDRAEAGTVDAMVDDQPPEPPRIWVLVVLVLAFAWPLLLVWCGGCVNPYTPPAGPIRVEVVKAPMPAVPYCELYGPPVPPPELKLNFDKYDVIDRVMVHYYDYNLVIKWTMYMQLWAQSVTECLQRLSNKPVVPTKPGAP